MDEGEPKVGGPVLAALGCFLVALLVASLGSGLRTGSYLGALIAFAGMIPAGYAAWLGVQSKSSQSKLLGGMVMMLLCGVLGVALVVLRLLN